jgi:hypothetical protein
VVVCLSWHCCKTIYKGWSANQDIPRKNHENCCMFKCQLIRICTKPICVPPGQLIIIFLLGHSIIFVFSFRRKFVCLLNNTNKTVWRIVWSRNPYSTHFPQSKSVDDCKLSMYFSTKMNQRLAKYSVLNTVEIKLKSPSLCTRPNDRTGWHFF